MLSIESIYLIISYVCPTQSFPFQAVTVPVKSGYIWYHNLQHEDWNWSGFCNNRLARWPAINCVVIVADSQSVLHKISRGMHHMEWVSLLANSWVLGLTWLYCLGHARVLSNEQADQLVGKTPQKVYWTSWTSWRVIWTNFAGMKNWNEKITLKITEWRNWGWEKNKFLLWTKMTKPQATYDRDNKSVNINLMLVTGMGHRPDAGIFWPQRHYLWDQSVQCPWPYLYQIPH